MDPTIKDENQKPAPSVPSVGLGSKEAGRIAEVKELLRHSETGPNISTEEREAGVEPLSEEPKLTQQDLNAGLQVSGEVQTPSLEPTGAVQLPQTEKHDLNRDVKGPTDLSRTWKALKSLFAGIKKPLKDALGSI